MLIRFSKISDAKRIIDFIKENWNENHVFVNNTDLFYYCHKENDNITYVIAEEDSEIYGVCGYIKSNHTQNPDIWAALWKVKKSPTPFLGMQIISFLKKETRCRNFSCCGIVPSTFKLYEFLGCKTETLEQWYWTSGRNEYFVADIKQEPIKKIEKAPEIKFEVFADWEKLTKVFDPENFAIHVPYKDNQYLKKRYFSHIKYHYIAVLLSEKNKKCVLVARKINCCRQTILKIVDILGNEELLEKSSFYLNKWFKDESFEYVYLYQYGINAEVLKKAGFTFHDENDENVIPNYFEPFEKKNVKIHFASDTLENFRMFCGDGDQDRPNEM